MTRFAGKRNVPGAVYWHLGWRVDINGIRQLYSISVEARFSASHHLRLRDGTLEQPHNHAWVVRVHFARAALDEVGMVLDFSAAQQALESVVARLNGTDLNRHVDFEGLNPTAELVAKYVFECLASSGLSVILRVEVTEAPGCVAAFERDGWTKNAE
jgi:6-pyruvoyltetrahydropterin/6-carboxytetrahydropterin synthase